MRSGPRGADAMLESIDADEDDEDDDADEDDARAATERPNARRAEPAAAVADAGVRVEAADEADEATAPIPVAKARDASR